MLRKSILVSAFLMLTFSLSSGQSNINWIASTNVAMNTFGKNHPRIVLTGDGNPIVLWGRSGDSKCFVSKWNGTAFMTPVNVSGNLNIATASWMGPDIAAFGDTVYVVMKAIPEADTSSHIYLARSFDGGSSFSSPVRVESIGDSVSRFPVVTTDAIGNPIVGFMKFNNSFLDSRWVVTKSADYGDTFNTDVKASGWGGSAEVCDCCPGALAVADTACVMLYRNNNNNIRDTWIGASGDGGATFYSGINVDNNGWQLIACPSTGPDGVIIGDSLYSVFMNGASGNNRNYFSSAAVSALNVGNTEIIAGATPGLAEQNYPRIANSGNTIAISWTQTVNGVKQLPLIISNNVYNGFSGVYDTVDVANITNTDVAINDSMVFVVWQDDNSNTVKFRAGNYNSVATNLASVEQELDIQLSPNPVKDQLLIDAGGQGALMEVYDITGRMVMQNQLFKAQQIDMQQWPNGIYYFRFLRNNYSKSVKVIKSN